MLASASFFYFTIMNIDKINAINAIVKLMKVVNLEIETCEKLLEGDNLSKYTSLKIYGPSVNTVILDTQRFDLKSVIEQYKEQLEADYKDLTEHLQKFI